MTILDFEVNDSFMLGDIKLIIFLQIQSKDHKLHKLSSQTQG